MLRALLRTSAFMLVLAVLAACGGVPATTGSANSTPAASATATAGATTAANGEQIQAVATTSIIADLVQNVGGERVDAQALLPPGTDPHTYAPTPSDAQAIVRAQIVFENGLGLEEWLEELIANAGGERPIVTVSNGLTPIEGGEHGDEHGDDHSAAATATASSTPEAEHQHATDPHMWFDVQNTIRYVENIRDGLKTLDPAGSTVYDQNAAAYIEQLQQLDRDIVAQLEQIPAERRKLITNHDTFGYFAKRYGFQVVGTVFEGVGTEQEPSAQQVAALVRSIREQNVPAVFTENTVSNRLAEQIADEAGVQVVINLYTDALGEPGSPGATYIGMMRFNVEQIVAALR